MDVLILLKSAHPRRKGLQAPEVRLNNPSFKLVEFDGFSRPAGLSRQTVKVVDIFGNDTMSIVEVRV